MNVSIARYALGVISLLIVCGSIATIAITLRRRYFPGWAGAPARLAEAVIALATLFLLLEVLGTLGIFRLGAIVAACLIAAAGTKRAVRAAGDAHPCAARGRG